MVQNGTILRCLDVDRRPLGALQMKVSSHVANRRIRRTIVVVFGIKKEIPA